MVRLRPLPRAVSSIAALFALAGCAGQGNVENHQAQAAAQQFAGSVAFTPTRACALLAPETLKSLEDSGGDCSQTLSQLVQPNGGLATAVQVYGKDAIVHLGSDTIFLARFTDGWRVTAAGCTPQPGRPYDCTVRGN